MNNRQNRIFGIIALLLVVAHVAVIVLSWLITAAFPQADMRSLLSAEGIRWLCGHIVENLAQPLLVWLILAAITWGTVSRSRIISALRRLRRLDYRQRFALRLVAAEAIISVVVLLLLTAVPHAILLGVTGHIYPSSFTEGLVPIICFVLTLFAATYGFMSGTLHGVAGVFGALTAGVVQWRFVWPLYLLVVQLWFSLKFVLML
ncbi:MAG: ABC transporter substrate-binding protein [Prevotella sp.]